MYDNQAVKLNPLTSIQLSAEEKKILDWMRQAKWEPQKDQREPIPYKAKVPEFFGGVRLFRMQAMGASAGSLGALELFIKKLQFDNIITKQGLYPLDGHGATRYISLKKVDLDNLGIGKKRDDDEDYEDE